ncbi:MAG: thioether cross-link-forming SCIFF peptide maturase, partial [Defluviitaleaceae bacterium]|nr:thioether cross-link-forming SCIFF peptide maturase [Defluviitaleaceae bacterium]
MVHTYSLNGYNIVIDTNSGAISVLDDVAFDVLEAIKDGVFEAIEMMIVSKHGYKAVREAYDEVMELKRQGLLFSEDTYEELVETV